MVLDINDLKDKKFVKERAELKLRVLDMRFRKIDPSEYYLSYSGGKDSHLLYWFIREYVNSDNCKNDVLWNLKNIKSIPIVSVNTRMEHSSIKERIFQNADEVLCSQMLPFDVKEKYGIPCFTKNMDDLIYRWRNQVRSPQLYGRITGKNTAKYGLSQYARELLIEGRLHPVSNKCCMCIKKAPLYKFANKHSLKPIMGVKKVESVQRDGSYRTCIGENGAFTPLFDFTQEDIDCIYAAYQIEIPDLYRTCRQSGCFGCPYGSRCGETEATELELSLLTPAQRDMAISYFKESYVVKGVKMTGY